ncbi:MAG: LysR family transcriptional regulator substrate-binding protein, partial [Lachnospiraceae bacterium]|nr:LysR family transcriptional regulator substrate-binding protein [Lachnospiraceae bacterium]
GYAASFLLERGLLREEELLFAIPIQHPYCRENPSDEIHEKELVLQFYRENFFISRKGTANRQLGDQLFNRYGIFPAALYEVNGIPMTRDMIAQGIGVGFIPASCRGDEEHIRYYSLSPKLFRYNALLHRKNLILNQPEQLFYSYVIGYYRD